MTGLYWGLPFRVRTQCGQPCHSPRPCCPRLGLVALRGTCALAWLTAPSIPALSTVLKQRPEVGFRLGSPRSGLRWARAGPGSQPEICCT